MASVGQYTESSHYSTSFNTDYLEGSFSSWNLAHKRQDMQNTPKIKQLPPLQAQPPKARRINSP
ncbi:Uncharacterised protein [Zhongshania aliphaticivorans]|uniref:Uncharacterized protein n=1 Tax=Zhongshania aliphaticivorans TaxID=1470434 RepID=A0A5S9P656_9GAMM|nr:Uncharacterised protein [Zhongshania aliphaticivorans]CAA0098809.1 Uncharacterised protein [Zhongshania aliphaticivorans]